MIKVDKNFISFLIQDKVVESMASYVYTYYISGEFYVSTLRNLIKLNVSVRSKSYQHIYALLSVNFVPF